MVAPKDEQFFEPPIWVGLEEWSLDAFHTAMRDTEVGRFELAADMCDAMWQNDRIRGVTSTRIEALLGLNDDDGLEFESESARIRKAFEKDWWRMAPEPELKKLKRWGLLLGFGVYFKRVVKLDGRWIPRICTWHPRWVYYQHSTHKWQVYTLEHGIIDIDDNDPHWGFYFPFGERRPWAEGLWRTLGLYWLVADRSLRAWGRHNDIYGSGAVVGTLPQGKAITDPDITKFWNQLKELGKNGRIVMPFGYGLDILESKGNTWETFKEAGQLANTAIAITVLGQPLTTEVPNAVKTGATAAQAVRQDYLEADAEVDSTWAHDALGADWAEWNFGDRDSAPYLKYKTDPKEDLSATATTLNTFADAYGKLRQTAPQIDFKALLEKFSLPIMEGASFEIEPIESTKPEDNEKEATDQKKPNEDALSETVTLASGDKAPTGFVEGQKYTDRLATNARNEATAGLEPGLAELMHIIEHLPDNDEWPTVLRAKLLEHYGSMSRSEFTRVAEQSMILAELAGRHAVIIDL